MILQRQKVWSSRYFLDEIEAIVYSGTKLNIDYFIEEVIDDDHVDDIYDYFMESETDDLNTALEELGEDYSEDEIRLVQNQVLVGTSQLITLNSFNKVRKS